MPQRGASGIPLFEPGQYTQQELTLSTLNDGIPDVWKVYYSLSTSDPAVANADYNSSGIMNLEKYRLNVHPFASAEPPQPVTPVKKDAKSVTTTAKVASSSAPPSLANGNFTGGVNIGNSTTNGGFTNASFHWSYNTKVDGWNALVGNQIEVWRDATGVQFVELNASGTSRGIEQKIASAKKGTSKAGTYVLSWRNLCRNQDQARDGDYKVHVFAKPADSDGSMGGVHVPTSTKAEDDLYKPLKQANYKQVKDWPQQFIVFTLTVEMLKNNPDVWVAFEPLSSATYGAFIAEVSLTSFEIVVPNVPDVTTSIDLPILAGSDVSDDAFAAPAAGITNGGGSPGIPRGQDFTPAFKPANELKIAKLEPGPTGGNGAEGAIIGIGASAILVPSKDPDCFYIRIPGLTAMSDGSRVSIKLKTTGAMDSLVPNESSNNNPAVEVELKYQVAPGAGAMSQKEYRTPTMILVSNKLDDTYSRSDRNVDYNIGTDDQPLVDDRTHIVTLGGKVQISSVNFYPKGQATPVALGVAHPGVEVKTEKSINVQVFRFSDSGATESKVLADMQVARETYAQAGISINFRNFIVNEVNSMIKTVEPPADLVNGSNVKVSPSSNAKWPSDAAKELLKTCGVVGPKNTLSIIYCADLRNNDGPVGGWAYIVANCLGQQADCANVALVWGQQQGYITIAHDIGHLLTNQPHFGKDYGYPPNSTAPNSVQISNNLMKINNKDPAPGPGSGCRIFPFQQNTMYGNITRWRL